MSCERYIVTATTGAVIDEFEVLPNHYSNTICYKNKEYPVNIWLDMLETKTAEALAVYTQKFYAGRTSISKNRYGADHVYYVGVMGNNELISELLTDIAAELDLKTTAVPEGLFMSRRVKDGICFTFYVNINKEPVTVQLQSGGKDVISGETVSGEVTVRGLDVAIIHSNEC